MGHGAFDVATDVDNCVIIGYNAGDAINNADADGTTLIGHKAGSAITVGQYNTALGYQALEDAIDSDSNTAIGYNALASMTGTSGETSNTAVGKSAGSSITTGNQIHLLVVVQEIIQMMVITTQRLVFVR